MPARVQRGTIVLRVWERGSGLNESEKPFGSLDELFDLCLRVEDPSVVDRVILHGVAEDGAPRTVTLAFQSATGLDET